MISFKNIFYEGVMKPTPEEQESYDRLVKINDKAGNRDFTDALLQWYRTGLKKTKKDISLDPSNHLLDTLKILNRNLSNGKVKPNTMVSVQTPKGEVKKDISNPKSFFDFEIYNKYFTNHLNELDNKETEEFFDGDKNVFNDPNIKLFHSNSDFVVFATKTYKSTLDFIRVLWPKMRGTSNLGAYGKSAYEDDLCPYCTSAKSHWNTYESGKNYTQYWILENRGNNLKNYINKGKETLYAMVDSDGDLLDKYDEDMEKKYVIHPDGFYEIIDLIFRGREKYRPKIFTKEQVKEKQDKFIYQIRNLCKEIDGKIVFDGSLEIPPYFRDLKPFSFIDKVSGHFDCSHNNLSSLEGAPQSVGWDFYCNHNNLSSLEGAPQSVGGGFYCNHNNLSSLEGAPQSVGGGFYCNHNNLSSLEGAPQSVGGGFYCSFNNNLTTLEGAPQSVGGHFNCSSNNLSSLEGAPQSVGGGFYCSHNELKSLKGAPQSVFGEFDCSNNKYLTDEECLQIKQKYKPLSESTLKYLPFINI